MMSRIEQLIGEIEEYIDSCKFQPLSSTKILVNKEELEELLVELRLRIPDEIKQYQKIISNQEAIINEAHTQANAILADATAQTNELVNEHEIMQKAYAEANRVVEEAQQQAQAIVDSAAVDANSIRQGAIDYTDDMLRSLQTIMSHTMEESRRHLEAFNASLQSTYDIVTANRNELSAGVSNAPVAEEQAQPVAPAPAQEVSTEEK
ncbi:vacuolar family H+-ATPase subunit H [Brotaphodocola sp.]|uniref:vacuolar family H+-ATPase subunit H n=1 Tax=Brotaphodocola sp. TaxID=3073577 RepID=UPI003D7E8087